MSVLPKRGRRRPYRQIERRYVVEYVTNRFPDRVWAGFNVRLGPPPDELRKRYPGVPATHFKVWTPTADAVVVTKTRIYIVEAKIRNPRQAMGQLLDYARRLPETPELQRFMGREIVKLLVVPFDDPELRQTCAMYGVQMETFIRPWVVDYMREVKLIP